MHDNMYNLKEAYIKYEHPTVSADDSDGYYQTLQFDSNMLPELTVWHPEEEYTLIIKVKQKNLDIRKDKSSAMFEVLEVGAYKDYEEHLKEEVKRKLK